MDLLARQATSRVIGAGNCHDLMVLMKAIDAYRIKSMIEGVFLVVQYAHFLPLRIPS